MNETISYILLAEIKDRAPLGGANETAGSTAETKRKRASAGLSSVEFTTTFGAAGFDRSYTSGLKEGD